MNCSIWNLYNNLYLYIYYTFIDIIYLLILYLLLYYLIEKSIIDLLREKYVLLIADNWFDSPAATNDGVCFNGQEVAELKELLINLAKDKAQLEQIIRYADANFIRVFTLWCDVLWSASLSVWGDP